MCYNVCYLKNNHTLDPLFPFQLLPQISACLITELLEILVNTCSVQFLSSYCLLTPLQSGFLSTAAPKWLLTNCLHIANSSCHQSSSCLTKKQHLAQLTHYSSLGHFFTWASRIPDSLGSSLLTAYSFSCPLLAPPHLPDPLRLESLSFSLLTNSPLLIHSESWSSHLVLWL